MVPVWSVRGAFMVSPRCLHVVPMVPSWCPNDASMRLPWCYRGAAVDLPRYFRTDDRGSMESNFRGASVELSWWFYEFVPTYNVMLLR